MLTKILFNNFQRLGESFLLTTIMNEDQKQKFLSLFENQGVAKSEQDFWLFRLEGMPEEGREHILILFETFPQEIRWLRDIQERKDKALADLNHDAWEAILKDEEEHFNTLLADKT